MSTDFLDFCDQLLFVVFLTRVSFVKPIYTYVTALVFLFIKIAISSR